MIPSHSFSSQGSSPMTVPGPSRFATFFLSLERWRSFLSWFFLDYPCLCWDCVTDRLAAQDKPPSFSSTPGAVFVFFFAFFIPFPAFLTFFGSAAKYKVAISRGSRDSALCRVSVIRHSHLWTMVFLRTPRQGDFLSEIIFSFVVPCPAPSHPCRHPRPALLFFWFFFTSSHIPKFFLPSLFSERRILRSSPPYDGLFFPFPYSPSFFLTGDPADMRFAAPFVCGLFSHHVWTYGCKFFSFLRAWPPFLALFPTSWNEAVSSLRP